MLECQANPLILDITVGVLPAGNSTRMCGSDEVWEDPNVSMCSSIVFNMIQFSVSFSMCHLLASLDSITCTRLHLVRSTFSFPFPVRLLCFFTPLNLMSLATLMPCHFHDLSNYYTHTYVPLILSYNNTTQIALLLQEEDIDGSLDAFEDLVDATAEPLFPNNVNTAIEDVNAVLTLLEDNLQAFNGTRNVRGSLIISNSLVVY